VARSRELIPPHVALFPTVLALALAVFNSFEMKDSTFFEKQLPRRRWMRTGIYKLSVLIRVCGPLLVFVR